MLTEDTIDIRVQYNETDGQGRVHHAQYLNYFERGRVEFMRRIGHDYKALEASGIMLVVAEMDVRYFEAAEFDDVLQLVTRVEKAKGARIEHTYQITRIDEGEPKKVVSARSIIASITSDGKVCRLPEFLRLPKK